MSPWLKGSGVCCFSCLSGNALWRSWDFPSFITEFSRECTLKMSGPAERSDHRHKQQRAPFWQHRRVCFPPCGRTGGVRTWSLEQLQEGRKWEKPGHSISSTALCRWQLTLDWRSAVAARRFFNERTRGWTGSKCYKLWGPLQMQAGVP